MANPLKKTMVFLGLAEEDLDDARESAPASSAPAARPAAVKQPEPQKAAAARPAVTPLRRVTPTQQRVQQPMNEILTVHPKDYSEAPTVAENFRDGIPVIINLSRMQPQDARRLIDFACGLTLGLNGKIERITGKVYLLSPEHIQVAGDEQGAQDGSFFVTAAN